MLYISKNLRSRYLQNAMDVLYSPQTEDNMAENREALDMLGEQKIFKLVSNPVSYYENKMMEYIRYYEPKENVQPIYDDLHHKILKDIDTLNRINSNKRSYSPMKYGDKKSLVVLAEGSCLRAWWNATTLDLSSTDMPKDTNYNRALRLETIRINNDGEYEINRDENGLFNQMKEVTRRILYDENCAKFLSSTHNGLTPVLNVDRFAKILRQGIESYPSQSSDTPTKKEQQIIKATFARFEKEVKDTLYYCDFTQQDPLSL